MLALRTAVAVHIIGGRTVSPPSCIRVATKCWFSVNSLNEMGHALYVYLVTWYAKSAVRGGHRGRKHKDLLDMVIYIVLVIKFPPKTDAPQYRSHFT